MKKLVLAYSGGLDTSYCATYLSKEENYEIHAVTVNTGGFSEAEVEDIRQKALDLGVASYTCIDAVESFYEKVVKYLIFGNVLKNHTYPLSVSAERIVQALEIVTHAKEIGAEYIGHGSTGAGNDQVRFDMIFQTMAPEMQIITPIRDQQLSRQEEIAYLKQHGVDLSWEKAKYSINKGLWGTSVGGAETLTSSDPLPEEAYPSQLKNSEPQKITLGFVKGELSSINGVDNLAVNNIVKLEEIASAYAIGRDIHVGDTIIGIKGRVGFEAAAAQLIIKAHHLLEKHTLSKFQLLHKENVSNWYGHQLHEGQYLDPVMRDFEAFLESSQSSVTGEVYVMLHPYRFSLEGIASTNDLMASDFGKYGEENSAWTADEAKGFIKINSNAGKILHNLKKQS